MNKSGIIFLGDCFFKSSFEKNPLEVLNEKRSRCFIVSNCETVILNRNVKKDNKSVKLISSACCQKDISSKAIDIGDIFTVANNHTFDYGEEGLQETIRFFEENDKDVIGIIEKDKTFLEINKKKICIFSCAFLSGKKYKRYPKASYVLDSFKKLKRSCDYLIVTIHWGAEYADYPSPGQRKLSKKMVDHGVDLIIGHHPHVFQGKEKIKGKHIYYSLGNANFGTWQNKHSKWASVSLAVDCDFSVFPPRVTENYYNVNSDYSLAIPKESEVKLYQGRFKIISDLELNWIQWGIKTSPIFFKQETEAFKVRFKRKELKQYVVLIYWLTRPKTIFLLLCFLITKFRK